MYKPQSLFSEIQVLAKFHIIFYYWVTMNRVEQAQYRAELLVAIEDIPLLELKSLQKIALELNLLGYTSPRGQQLTAMTIYRVISKKPKLLNMCYYVKTRN